MQIHKVIYGMLKSGLLLYKKLRQDLEKYGFEVNFYDPCIEKKQTKGHQMTVFLHVDDLKISCKKPEKITKMAKYLSKVYGDIKISREKVHEYLEMTLDYTMNGKVQISMIPYINNMID